MGLIAPGLIIGALYTLLGPEGVLINVAVFIHETFCYGQLLVDRLACVAALYHRYLRDGVERDGPHLARMISRQTKSYALCALAGT